MPARRSAPGLLTEAIGKIYEQRKELLKAEK